MPALSTCLSHAALAALKLLNSLWLGRNPREVGDRAAGTTPLNFCSWTGARIVMTLIPWTGFMCVKPVCPSAWPLSHSNEDNTPEVRRQWGNTAFSLCFLFCLLSAHSQGGAQAWPFYTLEQSLSIRPGMEAVSGYLKGFGSPKRLYLWACQKAGGEGWGLVFQRGGNPGAQTWSWPCFHSLLSFTSLSQHTQFTLWYPAHVDFGWGYPPELRIYDRANRHPSKESTSQHHERGMPLCCLFRGHVNSVLTSRRTKESPFPRKGTGWEANTLRLCSGVGEV